jgi:hypothetical protein
VIEHFASGLTLILRFADEPDWDGQLRKVPSLKRHFQGVLHEPRALPMGRP